ncbi:MAG: transposase [Sediminibacterium sp.]|nr:transposase [Sediminibacterium sp.]MDP3128102.1 transposase [Sediminibacterium sp.]
MTLNPKGHGRPKMYGAKIDLKGIDKRKWRQCYQTDEMTGYERIVYCVRLKQQVKVVYLEKENSYGVILSTDRELRVEENVQYYRLRFQIELLIRDAKKHRVLEDCRARDEQKPHYHFNMALGKSECGQVDTMGNAAEQKRAAVLNA